jgi:hypothetical protein
MDKDFVIQARRANIEEYLRRKGNSLLKEGKQYRVVNHSGLVVSGNKWYSHTLQKGGNALDYLIKMEGLSFKKAVELLSSIKEAPVQADKVGKIGRVVAPERNIDDKRVMAYLAITRGISTSIIIPLMKQGRIYESLGTHNCVMTGIDENAIARYVMQRSTSHKSSLKYESAGSDKKYSFSLKGQSDILCVFESPIDLLSYMALHSEAMKLKPHMLSLGGVTDIALNAYIERFACIHRIVFGLDNDKTGHEACTLFSEKYSMKGFKVYTHFPKQKDWNEQLLINNSCKSITGALN